MFRVVACVFEQHNLWLVLLAAVICVSACAATFFVLDGVRSEERVRDRRRWLFLAAMLTGLGTWATHFVAMLGYTPGLAVNFDLELTIASAVTCVLGAWAAFEIFDRFARGAIPAGLVLGGAVVAMHYIGTAGVQAAARQIWAPDLVVASWLLSGAFGVLALQSFRSAPVRYRQLVAAGLLVIAIVSLHFTAMSAMTLVPDPRVAAPHHTIDREMIAALVAIGAAATLLVGVVLAFADRRVSATELAAARHAAAMALHDALTGLPNRKRLFEVLRQRAASATAAERFAVVAIDLDRFKPVNDLYGHAVGDELLVKVAELLTDEASEDGLAARLGGDEFILLLPFESPDDLIPRLAALVAKFETPIKLSEQEACVGATLGVAIAPDDGAQAEVLLRRADAALYRAKEDGRGRFAFFEAGMDARAQERAVLEQELRSAVRADQIVPFFQPLVHLGNGDVSGYEILARWPHPTRGLVPPAQFIRVAEETGLIGELTFNILRRACREALPWPGAPRISLNIAPVQLQDPALPQKLLQVLSECGFPPARLEIEITEDALVNDFEAARVILESLKNLGVRIALDDFGTGYSSLRHLRELPFDVLKIDGSFVHSMNDSDEAMTIVRTIVQLAKNLGLGITAEGIETSAQAQELRGLGCDRGQGFLLGRPAQHPVETPAAEAPVDAPLLTSKPAA